MDGISTIAIVGGPDSGLRQIIDELKLHYGERVVFIPHAGRVLEDGGFPFIDTEVDSDRFDAEALRALNRAMVATHEAMRDTARLISRHRGANVIVCEGGIMDCYGALRALTPNTPITRESYTSEVTGRMAMSPEVALMRYSEIFCLESNPRHEFDTAMQAAWQRRERYAVLPDRMSTDLPLNRIKRTIDRLL